MAKYNYTHGEWRVYRGILIQYDTNSWCHWYIETCTTLSGTWPSKNPVKSYQIHKVYFSTLSEAKKYIDEF